MIVKQLSIHNFSLGYLPAEDLFKKSIINVAQNYFSRALKVRRFINPLKLYSSSCLKPVTVPSNFYKPGLPNTDLIVFVTSNNLSVSYAAYAGACEYQSSDNNNIVAGSIVINAPWFSLQTLSGKLTVVIHELTHLLGFAANLYFLFKNSNGQAYETSINTTVRGVSKFLFTGPNALARAREAFGCNTLPGIELEELGAANYPGSHWDKRIMYNDYMICIGIDAMPTTVTLGVLADSGWYQVDYTAAVVPIFGRGTGCGFADRDCVHGGVSANSSMWCTTKQGWTCDTFALYKAYCTLTTYNSPLPYSFQYFSSKFDGGADAYIDYCPYRKPYSNGACQGGTIATYTTSYANEVVGPNSRCFDSTLALNPNKFVNSYSACYQVSACNSTHATVIVGKFTLFCPFTGGTLTVPGYNGVLTCPASNILCSDVPCLNYCFGRGNCVLGKCLCDKGFSGADCSKGCPANCLECDANSNCVKCENNFLLINGTCSKCIKGCLTCNDSSTSGCTKCADGYFLKAGNCSECPSKCLICSSNSCNKCASGYTLKSNQCKVKL